jgi:hypothetical protein
LTNVALPWNNRSIMLRKTRNFFLIGSLILIILAIGLVAILDRTSSSTSDTDVRARAGTTNALMVNATVVSVDEAKGTCAVADLYFADTSRSGDAKNFGNWIVTAPGNFNLATLQPGTAVTMGIDGKTFLATQHTVTAITIVPQK